MLNVQNFYGMRYDPFINIIFVCFTDEQIDEDQLEEIKGLVSSTYEGVFIVVR